MRIQRLGPWLVPTLLGPWLAMVAGWLVCLVLGWLDGGHIFPDPVANFFMLVIFSTSITSALSVCLIGIDVLRVRRGVAVPTGLVAWLSSIGSLVLWVVAVVLDPLRDVILGEEAYLVYLAALGVACAVVARLVGWRPAR